MKRGLTAIIIERVLPREGLEESELRSPSPMRLAGTALIVCAAYYAGANLGFILRLPPTVPSVLWPPNSILTATLLLTPPRRWWLYLLAPLPAHLLAEMPAGWPTSLILSLFVTNCSEAFIGAACLRAISDAPTRFDTLRRVLTFVLAVGLFAPFASSFLDAAAVASLHDERYWLVWRTRFFSNVLTALTLVPAIVVVITSGRAWLRALSARRILEAAFLSVAFLVVGITCFDTRADGPWPILSSPHASIAFFLPFILWAAVRFGPGGASLSLLMTTLIVIWAAAHGRGAFAPAPASDSVLALQILLSVSAVPLLCLAGLTQERKRDQQALTERLRFEEWRARLSGDFVDLRSDRMDETLETWLRRLGQFLEVDRALLVRLTEDGETFVVTQSWSAPGLPAVPASIVNKDLPWSSEALRHECSVVWSRPGDLPKGAEVDRASLDRYGIRAGLALPLVAGGRVLGGVVLVTVAAERVWPPPLVDRLQLVTEVFANAFARKESEDAIRASEVMKSAILASLNSSVGVLDRDGRVIAVNPDWARSPADHGSALGGGVEVGMNYLDVCREAVRQGKTLVGDALAGIQSVLQGFRPAFAFEYPCRTANGERWYAMAVVPLNRAEGGAVVSHTEITERKRIELEAQRTRQELAHFTRVSTMGELTASLAHELNQPLTGILTNAQAARRFLDAPRPDLEELRHILADIIEDDKRAAEVIQRLRDLLRKGDLELRRLDLNLLIRDVLRLLASDTLIRNIRVVLELDGEPALVRGDRVQLQQVTLNLMLNAMEAMAESAAGDRTLFVRTKSSRAEGVEVSVEDTGPGLGDGIREKLVFEPFYTTKPAGMGMGLAISRSIIEVHGGAIWAENNPHRGATFRFRLPMAAEGSS